MLVEQLREDVKQALRDKNEVKKNILRVVIGEVETQESRTNKSFTDEEVEKVLRKMIASNQEVLSSKEDKTLTLENEILSSYLPKLLTQEEIKEHLETIQDDLKEGAEGQAIGKAMKYLKSNSLAVDGKDVSAVVQSLRG